MVTEDVTADGSAWMLMHSVLICFLYLLNKLVSTFEFPLPNFRNY